MNNISTCEVSSEVIKLPTVEAASLVTVIIQILYVSLKNN